MTTPLFRDYAIVPKEALGRLNRPMTELEAAVEEALSAAREVADYLSPHSISEQEHVALRSALARLDALKETKG